MQTLLDDPILERLPSAGRLVRLQAKYSPARLEAACARALRFDDPTYTTVKRILREGLENAALPEEVPAPLLLPRLPLPARWKRYSALSWED